MKMTSSGLSAAVFLLTILFCAHTSKATYADDSYYVRAKLEAECIERCGAGRECVFDKDGKMKCICARTCKKHYRPVCGDDGLLYINHCELHRRACISKEHVAIDHTNSCKKKKKACSKDQLRTLQLEMLSILKAEQTGKFKMEELVENLFKQYDEDNDRFLDKYELNGMLDDYLVYKPIKDLLLFCGTKDWIKSADQDGDYSISKAEFIKQLYGYSQGEGQEKRTKTVKIQEGTSIIIPTIVAAFRGKVHWRRNGENINVQGGTDRYSIVLNGSLLISPVYVDDTGTYTSCLIEIPSYCQTTILDVGAPPLVHLRPTDPVIDDGSSIIFECKVTGKPEPTIYWEKEGEIYQEYYGRLRNKQIEITNAKESDTGLYRCTATNEYGSLSDKTLLTVRPQDGISTIDVFALFGEDGIYVIDPEHVNITQKVEGNTVIKGTNKPICQRHKVIKCRWGPAVNVRNKYLYTSDITGNRIVIFDVHSLVPVEEILTVQPVREMRYVESVDKVLVVVRKLAEGDSNDSEHPSFLLIIPQASQEKQHPFFTMKAQDNEFQLNPGHLEVPPCSSTPISYTLAFITSTDYPGFSVLDLTNDEYTMFVNMSAEGCKRVLDVVYSYQYSYAFVQCLVDDEYEITAQFVIDMKNKSRIQMNADITGRTHVSPDGRYALSLGGIDGKIDGLYIDEDREIHKLGGIVTSVMLSEVAFYQKSTSYDVYITAKDYTSILILNADTKQIQIVKVLLDTGKPYKEGFDWESTKRNIAWGCAGDTHYAVSPATADKEVAIIDLQQRSIKGAVHYLNVEKTVVLLQRQI